MALQSGTRFGPYEILELAGAGGMGEVYKARDTRLERTVAIKVLPPHAASSGDLKQRFEREAQTIASLKHPHICVLHDVGHEGGTDFIVMEYLQGETLADRLARGKGRRSGATAARGSKPATGSDTAREPSSAGASSGTGKSSAAKIDASVAGTALKLDEALAIAIQIADALSQAHQHGVVHRDLKPANVMLLSGSGSQSGAPHVKLLDFGLAKLTAPADGIESAQTVHTDLTGPGMILGTVRYMAPEQIEGRNADARTDIFAFGVVLYEMLTGRKAFDGKSQPSLIAAIMNVDPTPLSALIPVAPRALNRLVTRCLAKDPDDRWQSAHDLLIQLRWIAGRGAKANAPAAVGTQAKRERWTLGAIAAGVLLTAGMSLPAYRYMQGPPEPGELRFRVPAVGLSPFDIAVSPDGETIAMVARPDPQETLSLYVRPVSAVTFRKLAGTENAAQPFWSPDSSTIGFVSGGRLKKVAASGAPPQEIGPIDGAVFGGTWSADGTILFGSVTGLRRISAEGGTPESVTTVEKPEVGHYWPHFLPDGKHFLYLAWSGEADKRAIFGGSIGSNDKTRVLAAESNPQYGSGYLIFRRDATVLAQPFDSARLVLSGGPVQLAGEVGFNAANGRGAFSVSQQRELIYFQAPAGTVSGRARTTANWQFGWLDRVGRLVSVAGEPGSYGEIDLSPDGRSIAVTRQDAGAPTSDIWVLDWQRGVSTKLTLDPADDLNPVWSPDGARIAFTSFRKGNADVLVKNANGLGPETPLLESTSDEWIEDWSKDGRYVIFRLTQGEFDDLYVLPIDAEGKPGKPFPVVQGPFRKDEPQFSYDGKWLAYGSDESGVFEIYVTSFPALDQKIKVTDGGGGRPRWRRDAKELFYLPLRATGVMTVELKPGPKLDVAAARELFPTPGFSNSDPTRHLWSVTPDGQRILMRTLAVTGTGVVPTVPGNFLPAQQAAPVSAAAVPPAANPASNGLVVVRHWTAAFRKAAK
jgi:serine/threonine protein kinase/Tol biopolymer transport system component